MIDQKKKWTTIYFIRIIYFFKYWTVSKMSCWLGFVMKLAPFFYMAIFHYLITNVDAYPFSFSKFI